MLRALDIKIEMLRRGISAAEVARDLGVSRSYVGHVIAGRYKGVRVRRALAKALGLSYEQVWGEGEAA